MIFIKLPMTFTNIINRISSHHIYLRDNRKNYEEVIHKFDNIDKVDESFKRHRLPIIIQGYLNSPIFI